MEWRMPTPATALAVDGDPSATKLTSPSTCVAAATPAGTSGGVAMCASARNRPSWSRNGRSRDRRTLPRGRHASTPATGRVEPPIVASTSGDAPEMRATVTWVSSICAARSIHGREPSTATTIRHAQRPVSLPRRRSASVRRASVAFAQPLTRLESEPHDDAEAARPVEAHRRRRVDIQGETIGITCTVRQPAQAGAGHRRKSERADAACACMAHRARRPLRHLEDRVGAPRVPSDAAQAPCARQRGDVEQGAGVDALACRTKCLRRQQQAIQRCIRCLCRCAMSARRSANHRSSRASAYVRPPVERLRDTVLASRVARLGDAQHDAVALASTHHRDAMSLQFGQDSARPCPLPPARRPGASVATMPRGRPASRRVCTAVAGLAMEIQRRIQRRDVLEHHGATGAHRWPSTCRRRSSLARSHRAQSGCDDSELAADHLQFAETLSVASGSPPGCCCKGSRVRSSGRRRRVRA